VSHIPRKAPLPVLIFDVCTFDNYSFYRVQKLATYFVLDKQYSVNGIESHAIYDLIVNLVMISVFSVR